MINALNEYLPPHPYCRLGHELKWLSHAFQLQSFCDVCDSLQFKKNSSRNGRYQCSECQKMYCLSCRKPIIAENKCPIGHEFKEREISTQCEICETTTNSKCYSDSQCSLNICPKCMNHCEGETFEFSNHFFKEKTTLSSTPFNFFDFQPICYVVAIYEEREESKNNESQFSEKFFINPFCNTTTINMISTSSSISGNPSLDSLTFNLINQPRNFFCEISLSAGKFYITNDKRNEKKWPLGVKIKKYQIQHKDVIKVGDLFMRMKRGNNANALNIKFYKKMTNEGFSGLVGELQISSETEETYIGMNSNDFLKSDPGISKQHAKIIYEYGDFIIFDTRSRTGLYLLIPPTGKEKIFATMEEEETSENFLFLAKKFYKIEAKPVSEFEWPVCEKNENHLLKWMPGSHDTCSICKRMKCLVYWSCPICNEMFCNDCKKPVFRNKRCPLYHKFKLEKMTINIRKTKNRRFCQLCAENLAIDSFFDEMCNYEICLTCKSNGKNN